MKNIKLKKLFVFDFRSMRAHHPTITSNFKNQTLTGGHQ